MLPIMTYAIPVWGYLAAVRKRQLQSVLDRGLRLAAKTRYRIISRLLRSGLGVRSLDDTVRRLARKPPHSRPWQVPVSYTHLDVYKRQG